MVKHLCNRSDSKSFVVEVIQSVFQHLNFLVRNVCYMSLHWRVMPQQAIEFLIGASLTSCKGSGKVARASLRFINTSVPAKFFVVVIGQCLVPSLQRVERFDDGRTNQTAILFA